MTKKKFLEELEKRLQILDNEERQDILNEYKDIIAEKVKHGKTEKEAIADFGSIDELTKEILGAYKINPDYNKHKESTSGDKAKKIVDNSEHLIKEGARRLSNFTTNLIDDLKTTNNGITIELVFEIIIKVILLLIGFAILRLPFMFVEGLGKSILSVAFSPIDNIFIFMWAGLVSILYFITCIVITIIVFKQYFNGNDERHNKKVKEKEVKTESINELKKENNSKNEKITKNSNSGISVLIVIIKLFVIISLLVPLFFINLGLIFALTCTLFLLINGVGALGLFLLIFGLIIIVSYISTLITGLLFEKRKVYFYPFIISLILLIVGGVLVIDKAIDIDYYNTIPNNSFDKNTIIYNEQINNDTVIYNNNGNIEFIINNDLEDGKVLIEASYYDEFADISKKIYNYPSVNHINIITSYHNIVYKKELLDLVIRDLKDDKIYNYTHLFGSNVKVYVNVKTLDFIKQK